MRKFMIPALAVACLAGATPALAEDVTIRIDLSNVDISDSDAVSDRIASSVARACSQATRFTRDLSAMQDCQADGTAKAMEAVELRREAAAAY